MITEEILLANGWNATKEEPGILFEKKIENRNPINDDPDDTDITLVLHHMFNTPQLAVQFPNGAMLNFHVESIEELNKFESQIDFYDCEY